MGILCRGDPKHSNLSPIGECDENTKCAMCGNNFFKNEPAVSCTSCTKVMHAACCNVDIFNLVNRKELTSFSDKENMMKKYSCQKSDVSNDDINFHKLVKCQFSLTKRKCSICRHKIGSVPKKGEAYQCSVCKMKFDQVCEQIMQSFIYPRRKNIIIVADTLEKLSTENGYLEECNALLQTYKEQYEMVTSSCKQVIVKMQEQVQELNEMVLKVSAAIPDITAATETSNLPTGDTCSTHLGGAMGPRFAFHPMGGAQHVMDSFGSPHTTGSSGGFMQPWPQEHAGIPCFKGVYKI